VNRRAMGGAVLAAAISAWSVASAQPPAAGQAISVTGTRAISLTGVQRPSEIWIDNLKKLPRITVSISQATDHGPVDARFAGALLWAIIDDAGWVNGAQKNAYLRHTILVTGQDGYAAALSEGEIDPKLEGKQVILAYEKDGVALDAPRLVVPGDAHASRGVHDVVSIAVQ